MLLEFPQIFLETLIWVDYLPLFLRESSCLAVFHTVFLHEEGDDEWWAPRHAHLAVDKHVVVGQFLFDEAVCLAEEGVDALFFDIVKLIPLMILYPDLSYLALHTEWFVGVIINDG